MRGSVRTVAIPSTAPVLYDKRGCIAEVALNRPHRLNAYDTGMRDSLYEILTAVRDDPEVAVMILYGKGPAFSTGGDLAESGTAPSPTAARAIRWQRDVWGTLWNLPQITVAAVHGHVVGGGMEMALLCDQCVAAAGTSMSLPESGLGMIPGVAGTQTLPRCVGTGWALDLVLSGRKIDARQARDLGIVQRVTTGPDVLRTARRLAARVSRLSPPLLRSSKRLVRDALDYELAAGLRRERRLAQIGT